MKSVFFWWSLADFPKILKRIPKLEMVVHVVRAMTEIGKSDRITLIQKALNCPSPIKENVEALFPSYQRLSEEKKNGTLRF